MWYYSCAGRKLVHCRPPFVSPSDLGGEAFVQQPVSQLPTIFNPHYRYVAREQQLCYSSASKPAGPLSQDMLSLGGSFICAAQTYVLQYRWMTAAWKADTQRGDPAAYRIGREYPVNLYRYVSRGGARPVIQTKGGNMPLGPCGACICPICHHEIAKRAGMLCVFVRCPKCGAMMAKK